MRCAGRCYYLGPADTTYTETDNYREIIDAHLATPRTQEENQCELRRRRSKNTSWTSTILLYHRHFVAAVKSVVARYFPCPPSLAGQDGHDQRCPCDSRVSDRRGLLTSGNVGNNILDETDTPRERGWYKHVEPEVPVLVLVCLSPNGGIMLVSLCYGGRTSDNVITCRSGFLDMLESMDVILADTEGSHWLTNSHSHTVNW